MTTPEQPTGNEQPHAVELPGFRELYHTQSWGADFVLPKNVSVEDFKTKLANIAKESGRYFSGYITESDNGGLSYHLTRNTRGNLDEMPGAMQTINEAFGVSGIVESQSVEPQFRVVFGMEEGYAENIKRGLVKKIEIGDITNTEEGIAEVSKALGESIGSLDGIESLDELKERLSKTSLVLTHTKEEIAQLIDPNVSLESAEIFGAQPPNEYSKSGGNYSEPAVVITGDIKFLPEVYNLADKFNQQRIIVEDFQKSLIWVVETPKCKS